MVGGFAAKASKMVNHWSLFVRDKETLLSVEEMLLESASCDCYMNNLIYGC